MTKGLVEAVAVTAVLLSMAPTPAAARAPSLVEITSTTLGRELATAAVVRWRADGRSAAGTAAATVRVWRLAPGEYVVAPAGAFGLAVRAARQRDGTERAMVSFDVEALLGAGVRAQDEGTSLLARTSTSSSSGSPGWVWLNQGCFSRISNGLGWFDTCYVLHGLAGEADPRDFYELEQYGTLGAGTYGKIYDGWLAAQQASGSSPMSWIDWSPRGSVNGPCAPFGLSVRALDVGISSSALMCEHWQITKWAEPGHFQNQWTCGCIPPFGQPYPNTRQVDYMQAVSVPNGGMVRWTLSAGFLAR